MTTPEAATLTLAAFLEARLLEDEAEANAATDLGSYHIILSAGDAVPHIARHDPARVLADVAAHRAIVALHPHQDVNEWDSGLWCVTCQWDICCDQPATNMGRPGTYPCPTLRHLATVYASHPDYRDDWRP